MAWVPIVIGIKPYYSPSSSSQYIEIIYRSDGKIMRLDYILPKEAKIVIEKDGIKWSAYKWRDMDGMSDWQYVTSFLPTK